MSAWSFAFPGALTRHLEDVLLQFATNTGVALDDVAEGLTFQLLHERLRKIGLVPEPIAIAQTRELINQNGVNEFADLSAVNRFLRQSAYPHIHIAGCGVSRSEFVP